MHALFLNRFYRPDLAPTSQLLTELAEDLVSYGWRVTVIAGRGAYDGPSGQLPRREWLDGVRVIRVGPALSGRGGFTRIAAYTSYWLSATWHLLMLRGYDVIVAMTDPPLTVGLAAAAAKVRRKRVVYWVQDVYPELAARLGVLREDSLVYRALRALAHSFYRQCDAIVALGPGMARILIAAGAPVTRVVCVDNWVDASQIRPIDTIANEFRSGHALTGIFVVLYSGNAGRAHSFDAVLDAARSLRKDPGIRFVFVGGGPRMPEVKLRAAEEGLTNFVFLEYQPRNGLSHSLSAADVSLVTEDPGVAGLIVPSKTYGILASGRPVLYVGPPQSDVAAILREFDCGIAVEADDGAGLAAAIQQLRLDPALRSEMGDRARKAAVTHYDRPIATKRWATAVTELLG